MTELLPGTWGTTPTYGVWYDRFIGETIRWVTATRDQYHVWHDSAVNHAVVYVGHVPGYVKPQLVEARPNGAQFGDFDKYGSDMIWANQFVVDKGTSWPGPITLTQEQRDAIVDYAIDCAVKKIGYNFLDFLAIGLAQQRFDRLVSYDHTVWWAERLARPDRLICSQLVDWCYQQAGVQLFSDGRPTGLVSPADLLQLTVRTSL